MASQNLKIVVPDNLIDNQIGIVNILNFCTKKYGNLRAIQS